MESYPSFDDELMSEIEMDWESEAWESWLKSDLLRTLPEDTQESVDKLTNDDIFECYREAMDETNTYPEAEYSGVSVDVDRIKESFLAHITRKLSES